MQTSSANTVLLPWALHQLQHEAPNMLVHCCHTKCTFQSSFVCQESHPVCAAGLLRCAKTEPHLEGVVLTTSGDTDPLVIEHGAAQVVPPTALEARVGIRQPGIGLGGALQGTRSV